MAEKNSGSRRDVLLLYHGLDGKECVERIKRAWQTMDTQIETVDTIDIDELGYPFPLDNTTYNRIEKELCLSALQGFPLQYIMAQCLQTTLITHPIQDFIPSNKQAIAPCIERELQSLFLDITQDVLKDIDLSRDIDLSSLINFSNTNMRGRMCKFIPTFLHFIQSINPDLDIPSDIIQKFFMENQEYSPCIEQDETIIYERDCTRDRIRESKQEQKGTPDLCPKLDQLDDYKVVFVTNEYNNNYELLVIMCRKLDRHLCVYYNPLEKTKTSMVNDMKDMMVSRILDK